MGYISSVWIIYYAAAGATATRREMYQRKNIFEKNSPDLMVSFIELMNFPNRPKNMVSRILFLGDFYAESFDLEFYY